LKRYRVIYSRRSDANITRILSYIAVEASPRIAVSFIQDLREHCETLSLFPQRGIDLGVIKPGLRLDGFRKTASIVFRIDKDTVVIMAVYYRGVDVQAHLMLGRRR
jgi:toxin ParE1/3/4